MTPAELRTLLLEFYDDFVDASSGEFDRQRIVAAEEQVLSEYITKILEGQ